MVVLNKEDMMEVCRRTFAALRQLMELNGLEDPEDQVAAGPPASEAGLKQLATAVSCALPPSYVQLLSIYDGITNFYWVDGELLPSNYRLMHPDFEKDWDRPNMMFFIMDDDWNAVAFDTTTRKADGEMEVQEFRDNQETKKWPSLSDFLVGYRDRVEGWLADARADRAQVDDD